MLYDLKTDVVVIGGGAIGTSIAYNLSLRNIDVILVERDDIASGTSGSCDGFVFMQSKKPGIHLEMALESARMMEQFSTEFNIEYKKSGGMIIIESIDDIPGMKSLIEQQRISGLKVDLLDSQAARDLEPALSDHIAGASYSPMDAQVNPMYLCFAYANAARQNGTRFLLNTEVISISIKNRKVESIQSSAGIIKTEVVVNAAGAYAPMVGRMAGIDLPIVPRRGQVLVTESLPRMLKRIIICNRYIKSKFGGNTGDNPLGVGLAIEQTRAGTILIGSTREFAGYDRRITEAGIRAILEYSQRFIPIIKDFNIIRSFAGLRPYTPGGMPILAEDANIKGFITAAGHEGDGIALSPITGHLVAEFIACGREFPIF